MVLETDAYTETISILNDIEGVSIAKVDGKKTVYITLDCEKDRIDAQNNVEKHLKKVAQPIRTNKSAKSSFDLTELRGTNIFIVYNFIHPAIFIDLKFVFVICCKFINLCQNFYQNLE